MQKRARNYFFRHLKDAISHLADYWLIKFNVASKERMLRKNTRLAISGASMAFRF